MGLPENLTNAQINQAAKKAALKFNNSLPHIKKLLRNGSSNKQQIENLIDMFQAVGVAAKLKNPKVEKGLRGKLPALRFLPYFFILLAAIVLIAISLQ